MLKIKRWKELGEFFKTHSGMNSFIYGATDEDILAKVEKLNQEQYPVLVGILPSIMGTGMNMDNMGHESPLFYYCMVARTNMDESEMDAAWEQTLESAQGVEETIKEHCEDPDWREFFTVKPNSVHIDPEFDMWGLMGWSIGFEIEHAD